MAMCKCKKSNPRNPRPCGCMSNPKGVKMYHVVVIPPAPFGQLGTQWHSRSTVTRGAFDTKAQAEEWARKNLHGHAYSIKRKSRGYANPRRNPAAVQYGSEDYKIGLFQGAVEKGKLPPPPSTSRELQQGYAAGARIAKVKPAAVQRALGVYSATHSHAKAGDALKDATLGGDPVANPRRNPAAKGYVKIAAYEDKKRKKPTVRDEVYFEAAGPFVRSKLLKAGETLEKVKDDADTITHAPTGMAIYSPILSRYENSKKLVVAAMRDLRQWIKKLSKDELRTISEGFTFGSREMTPAQEKLLREAYQVCRSGRIERNPRRNPMSAAARKHLAHEKSEERSFASLLNKLPIGETVTLGGCRVRKLSKGFVVINGERLTAKEAAAKIHRGK